MSDDLRVSHASFHGGQGWQVHRSNGLTKYRRRTCGIFTRRCRKRTEDVTPRWKPSDWGMEASSTLRTFWAVRRKRSVEESKNSIRWGMIRSPAACGVLERVEKKHRTRFGGRAEPGVADRNTHRRRSGQCRDPLYGLDGNAVGAGTRYAGNACGRRRHPAMDG
jgi:hypothetical protein